MSFLSRLWRSGTPDGTPNAPYELPAEDESQDQPEPELFGLVLLNDDTHTFDYVITVLHNVFGISAEAGYAMAETIHLHGWRVIFTGSWQEVVQKRAEVLACGPDPRMPNSTGPLNVEIHEAS